VLRRDSLAERVSRRLEAVVRALAGTDPEARQKAADWAEAIQPDSANTIIARGLMLAELSGEQAVEPMLQAIVVATDPDQLGALAEALAALPAELSNEQAMRAVLLLVRAIRATTITDEFETRTEALTPLATGLAALAGRLSEEQAESAAELMLEEMIPYWEMAGYTGVMALAEALAPLAGRLSDEQAEWVVKLLRAVTEKINPSEFNTLARGLAPLAGRLGGEQAERAVETLFAEILAAIPMTDQYFQVGLGAC
jgi:hypothetical protein